MGGPLFGGLAEHRLDILETIASNALAVFSLHDTRLDRHTTRQNGSRRQDNSALQRIILQAPEKGQGKWLLQLEWRP
jgi:hypothetical protein